MPVWFTVILLVGAVFRFTGLDWDQGQHLHPDERFLTMIEAGMHWPSQFVASYFNEGTSTLNPVNLGSNVFFVYGDFPLILVKAVAILVHRTGYDQVYLLGRGIEALVDVGTIALVFLLARRLYRDDRVALLAALFYALSALAIQQAHFFVVDGFSVFFVTAALYFTVGVMQSGRRRDYALAGLCIGLGLASKFSVYPVAEVLLVAGAVRVVGDLKDLNRSPFTSAAQSAVGLVIAGALAFVAFRIFQPYAFQGPGILGLHPAPRWIANGRTIQAIVTGTVEIPYSHQWADRLPIIFPLENLVIWGMGIPLGLTAVVAWTVAAWQLLRHRVVAHLVPVLWTAMVFGLVGTGWVMYLRYFLPVYPTLAALAAWFLVWLWDRTQHRTARGSARRDRLLRWTRTKATALMAVAAGGTLLYAAAFTSIYTRPPSRLVASRWIAQNIPPGTAVANESPWDDSLPLGGVRAGPYQSLNLDLTAEDTPAKLEHVLAVLDQADYLFISSNRQYGSLTRLPVRFPMVTKYYDALFSGALGFAQVAEFTSYPRVFGIEIPDQGAEESWTVYDHPRVQIFRKTPTYSHSRAEGLLGNVNWQEVLRLPPRQESQTHHFQLLGPNELSAYVAGGTWRSIFDPESWSNRYPVIFWVAGLIVAGAIAFPFVWLLSGPLPDRGYAFTRPIGLLAVSWVVWWWASLRVVAFSRGGIMLATTLVAAGAAAAAWSCRREMAPWLRGHIRLLLLEEGIFWGAFLALLVVRWANPDLWHPTLGGEKPMDFAYLNAVIKSPYFPPFDPWLAGGYLNYYYFGFVLVAVLTKVTAIVPSVAYNLAIPAFFGFVALGAFSVSLSLLSGHGGRPPARRVLGFAVLGAVFVGLAGNLAELRVIGSLAIGLLTGHPAPLGIEHWYWDPSRVIHHPIGEAGPITEFPAFTFLFADLHAHLLALPYTLVVLGLAAAFVRGAASRPHRLVVWARLALLALVLGVLWAINAWDLPTYALLALAAVVVASVRRPVSVRSLWTVAVRAIALGVLSYGLFLPFHLRYASAFAGIARWNGSQTPLRDYLTIHGLFLFCIAAGMLVDLWFARDLNPAARLLRLGFRQWQRLPRLAHLHGRMVVMSPQYGLGLYGLGLGAVLTLGFVLFEKLVPALTIGLMTLAALLVVRRERRDKLDDQPPLLWQSTLVMVVVGLGLTLAVEFFVAANIDIGRMNTVFKTYLQVWVLLGIAAAVSARLVFQRLPRVRPRLHTIWSSGFAVLLAAALLYPILATPARVGDRFDRAVGPSLNGMLFLDRAIYTDHGQRIPLAADGAAIRWVQNTLVGSPVIAEVNTTPTLYGWGNRYAVFTGNPAVIGWDWHQRQQRPLLAPLIARRIEDIQAAYRTPDPALAHEILARYGVRYIVVGPLERAYFPDGQGKWEAAAGTYWTLAYANSQVVIYQMMDRPFGLGPAG